jgi:hypothetical protein
MRSLFFALFVTIPNLIAIAQVDHYETLVDASETWQYFPGTVDPGGDWFIPAYDDNAWSTGPGGIGYGDNDDGTTISPVVSVYLRRTFEVIDINEIATLIFSIDYDDGFVAYLNGTEIGRRNVGESQNVPYNQPATGLREAVLYSGGIPETVFTTENISDYLVNGENILAIQVHNESLISSDLSSSAFLVVGMNGSSIRYGNPPSWFQPPFEFKSSDLPIISIQTNGQAIDDEIRIVADMGIIDNGTDARNNVTDPFNNYEGRISIEIRGESSQMFPKKSFTIETQDANGANLNAALLGLPPDNDWVLYAPYTDKTMMRDVLAYKMGRDLGQYAPRTRYVELVLNGEYQGVYVLIERIKIDKNRVDIATLKPEDNTGDELTGGYILRVDKFDANDYPFFTTNPSPAVPNESSIRYQYADPDGEDLTAAQRSYAKNFLEDLESSLGLSPFSGSDEYKNYIDVDAFVDFMIVNEVGKNVDAYVFSTYMHKDKDSNGGLLKMGPLWDFNLAFGNVDYWENSQFAPGWMYTDGYRMYWFRRLMQDTFFKERFNCRWKELRSTVLTNEYFTKSIDSLAIHINESQQRNFQRWPILGVYVWPNQFIGQTFASEINFMKSWIQNRLAWMDQNTAVSDCPIVTGVEKELAQSISVHPTPAAYFVTVESRTAVVPGTGIAVYDLLGNLVLSDAFNGDYTWTFASDIANGVYLIRITTPGRKSITKRVVVSR